ncbi:MAG: histidine utilization repressor [Hyphomicrobiaceae bacterium]|nr:histidine utilization repressor [Hyphomicrobiaceae bacterium]
MEAEQRAPAAFQRIKEHVLEKIRSGEWKQGDLIPTEEAFTKTFGVSRMTVNRALRELAADQIVVRIQGSGTFVAQEKFQATLVEIKSIADEVKARGHTHRSELQLLERARANDQLASEFDASEGAALFHSLIVHFEDKTPIQVEDRWVNAKVAPDYMSQDFSRLTPNEYLMRAAPLQGVLYRIEAEMPPAPIGKMLEMSTMEPCLVLRRKTYSGDLVASVAVMWHPGSKYQFSGKL